MPADEKLPPASTKSDRSGRAQGGGRDRPRGGDRDMGASLRRVYQKTVDETVPADLLDLLGKLD